MCISRAEICFKKEGPPFFVSISRCILFACWACCSGKSKARSAP